MNTPWFYNDQFWIDYHPLMFDPDRLADTEQDALAVLRLAGRHDPAKILDLCCGQGRHALVWQQLGIEVTGIDLCRAYIEDAEKSAVEKGLGAHFITGDVRTVPFPGEMDLAVNLFTSFGYFCDRDEDQRLAEKVYLALNPGGAFVIETQSLETTCLNFQEREWFERDGLTILKETRLCDAFTRVEKRWIFMGDDEHPGIAKRSYTITHSLYSAFDLGTLLSAAGFPEIEFYGGYDGKPYDKAAETMIAVARK